MTAVETEVAIVGAGFGGLGAAVRLRQRGMDDFVVLERADDLGGTWRDNDYPGCACDVPSHLYSYSFALNPHWTETFSGQQEIWAYLRECVERFGLAGHLRFGHEVTDARWDAARQRWVLQTPAMTVVARVLILATGPLSEPARPDIAGRDTFAGTMFHSAQWRHDHDLAGERVAVIGTGASAVQFVPRIQPRAAGVTVFQRTPPWIMPRRNRPISRIERAVYARVPAARRLARALLYWGREFMGLGFVDARYSGLGQRIAARHLARQIPDPALRARLTPSYRMGCKRVLISNDYLPTLMRSNVELVTEAIREIRPHAVVTADGTEHAVDTIIFGTGFHVTDPSIVGRVHGRGGRSLAEAFAPSMRALRGTTVEGFPNLFMVLGPNTGLGHTSVVLMIESQLRHMLDVLDHMRRHAIAAIEPTPEAQREWTRLIDTKMERTVWTRGGCRSWYLDASGRNSTIWPGYATGFRLRLRHFRAGEYAAVPPAPSLVEQREGPGGAER